MPNGGFGATSINKLEGFIDPLVGMNRELNDVKISVLKSVLNSILKRVLDDVLNCIVDSGVDGVRGKKRGRKEGKLLIFIFQS